MNRNASPAVLSNRPLSRRLHRRPAASPVVACLADAQWKPASPDVVTRLPERMVRDAGMFELLAAQAQIAALEEALAQALDAASTDPLTGALNRRGFDEACRREVSRAQRNGNPVAVAHLDLDDFKRLNDAHGHAVGDRALVCLVDVLRRSMRPTDVLCRFGGEEFVLLFPETALDDAARALSRFLAEFSAAAQAETGVSLSFSAGLVALCPDEAIEAAIGRADAATYAAKRAGKRRVLIAR